MCGINGFVNTDLSKDISGQLDLMNSLIYHRGPDSTGSFAENIENYNISMGMRRLSIIDVDNGNQPIFSEDKSKVIVLNGEIYNYKILKNELIEKGYHFTTESDTEVVLRMYEAEGPGSFGKLDGMFAFSIFDRTLNKVYIARDFFGEKPLYYWYTHTGFVWASELKSLISTLNYQPRINRVSLSLYFQLTYIPAPFTIYEGIRKLEANHYLEINCVDCSFLTNEIPVFNREISIGSRKQAVAITRELVRESVASRSISDVPIGAFLSGGVDSSIVSLCLAQQQSKKVNTFSIGFEKKSFDETDKSKLVAKLINSNHHQFIIEEKCLSEDLNRIILNFDEPFADSSALANYIVSEKTRDYVKVALTGDGGDEVFGGYNKYYIGKLNQIYTRFIPELIHEKLNSVMIRLFDTKEDRRGLRFKSKKFFEAISYSDTFYYDIISMAFKDRDLNLFLKYPNHIPGSLDFYKRKFDSNTNDIKYFRSIDKLLSLEGDMLTKVDRTSMLTSLECRAPFLNKELWNFTNQLPDSYLINGWDKKYILKEAFKEFFPRGFLNKSKRGFGVPVGDWLRSELRAELISYIDKSFIEKQNIFTYDAVADMVYKHLNGKVDNTFKVWTFFCFQKWYNCIYK